jgi:hypothetical protein
LENKALASNFDGTQPYQWVLFGTSQGVENFNASDFAVNDSGFLNPLDGGSFAVAQQGNNVVVKFTPQVVPEPSTWVMLLAAGSLLIAVGRREERVRRDSR